MAVYRMDDGKLVDTDKTVQSWDEQTYWDGNNRRSVATGSQWVHERLHKSRKGRYYIERWSQCQGSTPSAEWVTEREATAWLLLNGHDLPEDLKRFEAEVCE